MVIVHNAGYNIFFFICNSKNISTPDDVPGSCRRAQKIYILPYLIKDDGHAEQEFVPVIQPVISVKCMDNLVAVKLHGSGMFRFIIEISRNGPGQFQILGPHIKECRILRLHGSIEKADCFYESHTHHGHILYRQLSGHDASYPACLCIP